MAMFLYAEPIYVYNPLFVPRILLLPFTKPFITPAAGHPVSYFFRVYPACALRAVTAVTPVTGSAGSGPTTSTVPRAAVAAVSSI